MSHHILICQNRTCRKQGSPQVLKAFQAVANPETIIQGTGCLGSCGNGPMVVILPDEIWYTQVSPEDVDNLIQTL